jgi:SAM-dependent methyltransferase
MVRTRSNLSAMGVAEKWRQAVTFFRWKATSSRNPKEFDALLNGLEENAATYEQATGKRFADARVFEIGYGARPMRMFALMSMGIDVWGIDLDAPLYEFSLTRVFEIVRRNGPERALKSAVRNVLFDAKEQAILRDALRARGHKWHIDATRFLIGDAAVHDYSNDKYDLIFSDDVLEHIPRDDLGNLLASMANAITPLGILILTPLVFTGISGNHLPEWFPYLCNKDIPRRSEPWEHLRKDRWQGNVYLNRMTRADYREILSRYFEIIEERPKVPDLGRRWLTPEVQEELSEWSEDELFSNRVRFVLRAKQLPQGTR